MRTFVFVYPCCGLCNRMRAIASAQKLAKANNARLIVLWEKTHNELFCGFQDLFEPVNYCVFEFEQKSYILRIILFILLRFCFLINDDLIRKEKSHFKFRNDKNYLFWCCGSIFDDETYESFVMKKELHNRYEKFVGNNVPKIGIHIRRTDHSTSITYSSTDLFVSLIESEIKKDSNTVFYLATDDTNESNFLHEKFGNSIISYPKKSWSRDSQEGMEEALIELYALSKCEIIYGSLGSSYSETAAKWGGVKLKLLC